MNRPIKFRAWKWNQMIYWGALIGVEKQSYTFFNALRGYEPDCTLMQFTGLLDKNGKEIYEGDIVKVQGEIREIVFEDYAWLSKKVYHGKDGHISTYCLADNEKYQVIGNIYENPELLK